MVNAFYPANVTLNAANAIPTILLTDNSAEMHSREMLAGDYCSRSVLEYIPKLNFK